MENGLVGLIEVWARSVSSLGLYAAEAGIQEVVPRCGDVDVGRGDGVLRGGGVYYVFMHLISMSTFWI